LGPHRDMSSKKGKKHKIGAGHKLITFDRRTQGFLPKEWGDSCGGCEDKRSEGGNAEPKIRTPDPREKLEEGGENTKVTQQDWRRGGAFHQQRMTGGDFPPDRGANALVEANGRGVRQGMGDGQRGKACVRRLGRKKGPKRKKVQEKKNCRGRGTRGK